jgi:nitroimidazol reductase NimA-like FMN-containing flavoprotein (pyridoxamine 5'-phosphate oxidase superfamily)
MTPDDVAKVLDRPLARDLLSGDIPARLAYTAKDGTPRVIPIGFLWTGTAIVVCTVTISPKVEALAVDPAVALTIDTNEFPPKILLVRGTAEMETVDGIPDEYVTMSRRIVAEEQREAWLAEVTSLYQQMVRITITPTWAKVIDFETTLPSAVEELARRRDAARA